VLFSPYFSIGRRKIKWHTGENATLQRSDSTRPWPDGDLRFQSLQRRSYFFRCTATLKAAFLYGGFPSRLMVVSLMSLGTTLFWGPLLFGISAKTVALVEATAQDPEQIDPSAEGLMQSVEALQQANRRILDRLRPLYIQELGLEKSIQTLLQNAQLQAPQLELTSKLDNSLAGVDGPLSQTIHRVIQEAVTNVLRHAYASSMNVRAAIQDGQLIVEISDDGIGLAENNAFGRGLTGMHERARALGGSFRLFREDGRTYVSCLLPIDVEDRIDV
jgi:two-component sensor histidine kinase